MAIKRIIKKVGGKVKTTPKHDFLNEYLSLNGVINIANKKIGLLADAYVAKYCQYKIGQALPLDASVKPGYDSFIIETIRPLVKQGELNKTTKKRKYQITFSFYGEFIPIAAGSVGYDSEAKNHKGSINLATDETSKAKTPAEKSATEM